MHEKGAGLPASQPGGTVTGCLLLAPQPSEAQGHPTPAGSCGKALLASLGVQGLVEAGLYNTDHIGKE